MHVSPLVRKKGILHQPQPLRTHRTSALRAVLSVLDWQIRRITFLAGAVHAMSPAGGEGANTARADTAAMVAAFKTRSIDGIAAYEKEMRERARAALQRSMNYAHSDRTQELRHA